MKTVGKTREDGTKDYVITHEGRSYHVVRQGARFKFGWFSGTLKEIKGAIASGLLFHDSDKPQDESHAASEDEPHDASDPIGETVVITKDQWACMHPCAILALCHEHIPAELGLCDDIMHTLDAFAWLDDKGNIDIAKALRDKKFFSVREQARSS